MLNRWRSVFDIPNDAGQAADKVLDLAVLARNGFHSQFLLLVVVERGEGRGDLLLVNHHEADLPVEARVLGVDSSIIGLLFPGRGAVFDMEPARKIAVIPS
jgi:hypothetical protein